MTLGGRLLRPAAEGPALSLQKPRAHCNTKFNQSPQQQRAQAARCQALPCSTCDIPRRELNDIYVHVYTGSAGICCTKQRLQLMPGEGQTCSTDEGALPLRGKAPGQTCWWTRRKAAL